MIGIILTGHNKFATGITSSLKLIVGEPKEYKAVDFLEEYSLETLTKKIKEAIDLLKHCESILILTDLVGGSPYNVATKLVTNTDLNIKVIGGINLACLIEACITRETSSDLAQLTKHLVIQAKNQIVEFGTEEKEEKEIQIKEENIIKGNGKIVHARVDERLIHGQVAMVWTNTVGASRIVVVNNEALKDETMLLGLKMAKPAGVKVSVLSIKRAIKRFKENAFHLDNVFVITKNIKDMAELVRNGLEIDNINIGNVAKREGSINIKKSVNLTKEDIDNIKEMIDLGHTVTAQMIPSESDQSILNYL